MKQALISPSESVETGYRIAEVVNTEQTFEVGGCFWTPCADDVLADQFWYDPSNELIKPILASAEANKQTAIGFLQETDWATISDVADPAISNPYLTNQQAYFDYRNIVRGYAINPVAGNIDWPIQPTPIWS